MMSNYSSAEKVWAYFWYFNNQHSCFVFVLYVLHYLNRVQVRAIFSIFCTTLMWIMHNYLVNITYFLFVSQKFKWLMIVDLCFDDQWRNKQYELFKQFKSSVNENILSMFNNRLRSFVPLKCFIPVWYQMLNFQSKVT